jgi:serine phosphatase RsbU (regulator of sigma subunit)
MLASLAGLILASKNPGSDAYARARRSRQLALQAELVWALLAPRTFAADQVTVAAALEPAYEVGGDAYDYSLTGDHLHVSLFDAVGHDLGAGLLTSVAMAACRSTRRSGGTLHDMAARADQAISRQFGDSLFVTALLCDLNVATGEFSWIPCGHHPPLLIRSNNTARELARPPRLPLGLAGNETRARRTAPDRSATGDKQFLDYTEQLEPGDRILLYTDGVTEARAADGTQFGVGLLTEFVIRHSQSGTPAPEMLRHLSQAITDHQHGPLRDDATIVLIDWTPKPGAASSATPPGSFPATKRRALAAAAIQGFIDVVAAALRRGPG